MGGRGGSSGIAAKAKNPFPALAGTEKQVKWAEQIRKEKYENALYVMSSAKKYSERMGDTKDYQKAKSILDESYSKKTDASYWIDHRVSIYGKITPGLESDKEIRDIMGKIKDQYREYRKSKK